MDFQSLARKDLQTLCKKNKIPANITNVAMAEALAALQEVAGIEEFLNLIESESKQSEDRIDNGSPGHCRTSCRTSTRRKSVKEESPFTQSIIRTRRGRAAEMAEQENKDLNISSTPSLPSNRRRVPVPSARKRVESHSIEGKEEEKDQINGDQKRSDVLETPSIPKTQRKVSALGSTRRKTDARVEQSSIQGGCSTRRSMRLLEKTMENLSLMESGSIEPVVADKLFEELPERKEICEQKNDEIDSNLNSFEENRSMEVLGHDIDESNDPEGVNETTVDEEEQTITMTVMEPLHCESENKIQSDAATEEYQDFTPSCTNDEKSTENFNKEMTVEFNAEDLVDVNVEEAKLQCVNANDSISEPKMEAQVLSNGESSFKLIDVHVVESEMVKNSIQETSNAEEQFTPSCTNDEKSTENFNKEMTVEFNAEDLVDINVEEAKLQCVNAHDSISEPKMEAQVLSNGESSFKEMVEFDIGELIDVHVVESEMVENSIQETSNAEEQVKDYDSKDPFREREIEDLSKSEEIPVENPEKMDSFSFPEPRIEEDLSKSDETLAKDSEKMDNFSFKPFAVDRIQGQFPRPAAEVRIRESRTTSLEIFDAADQDEEEMKNKSNEDEEMNLSLRQLRKMVKELELSRKTNKEKTHGKEQGEKVVRTALQPLSENCMAKDGQDNNTTTNSMFIQ